MPDTRQRKTPLHPDQLLAELRRTYDLLPGHAACDLLARWPAVLGWLRQYIDSGEPFGHTPVNTVDAGADLHAGRYYLSGGESVIAHAVVNLLDSALPFDLHQLWRLDPDSQAVVFQAITTHR